VERREKKKKRQSGAPAAGYTTPKESQKHDFVKCCREGCQKGGKSVNKQGERSKLARDPPLGTKTTPKRRVGSREREVGAM